MSRTVAFTVRDSSRKGNHLGKAIWVKHSSTGPLAAPDKHISRWVDRENLIYVRWNGIKICGSRQIRSSIEEKESKTPSEIKQEKNISKNLQSFLEIRPMQKEVLQGQSIVTSSQNEQFWTPTKCHKKTFPWHECSQYSHEYKWYLVIKFQLSELFKKFRQPVLFFWYILS